MLAGDRNFPGRGFTTPPPRWMSVKNASGYSPRRAAVSESKKKAPPPPSPPRDPFHSIHKVPAGDSPYVKAKHIQLIEKDPSRAISLFWAAINSGDRVDSALKDMAVVMKQLARPDEAVEAIKSFRHLCQPESQEPLDNVLVELYKKSGRLEEQIILLEHKVKCIDDGSAFGGKRTKVARSQGKKIQITIEQEKSRLLGNLAWAYMRLNDFSTAERLYRDALSFEPDKNKECNIAVCLMHTNRLADARSILESIRASSPDSSMEESYGKSFERASQLLAEMEAGHFSNNGSLLPGPRRTGFGGNAEPKGEVHSECPNGRSVFSINGEGRMGNKGGRAGTKAYGSPVPAGGMKSRGCVNRRLSFEGLRDDEGPGVASKNTSMNGARSFWWEASVEAASRRPEHAKQSAATDQTPACTQMVASPQIIKRSWAEMVEEEEEEQGRWDCERKGLPYSREQESRCRDVWKGGEGEFCNENLNNNIIQEARRSLILGESLDLNMNLKPQDSSPRNLTAQYFDPQGRGLSF